MDVVAKEVAIVVVVVDSVVGEVVNENVESVVGFTGGRDCSVFPLISSGLVGACGSILPGTIMFSGSSFSPFRSATSYFPEPL